MSAALTSRAYLQWQRPEMLPREAVCSFYNRHCSDPIWLTKAMYCGIIKSAQKELLATFVCTNVTATIEDTGSQPIYH